jgi:hypothetical protein
VIEEHGVRVHNVDSPYQNGPTEVLVLLPDRPAERVPLSLLMILPVEAGRGQRWGDGLEAARRLDLHNRYQLICVQPTFSDLPWYADHPTDPSLRQESHLIEVVLPLLDREYPQLTKDPKQRLLVGFSKSGWGAWSLLLRHPQHFGRAAAWDAPLAMTRADRFGSGPIFGTPENFRAYELLGLLERQGPALGKAPRLMHFGYGSFREHHRQIEARLSELSIPHVYRDGPPRAHHWDSGWLAEAVACLVQNEDELPGTPVIPIASPEAWDTLRPWTGPPREWQGEFGHYRSVLTFADGTPVHTSTEWQRRRAELLTEWHTLLGAWPPLLTDPQVELLETTRRENFLQHRVRFRWLPEEHTTGYLLIPDGPSPRPAVLTVYYEPETAIGLGAPDRDFALQLTRRGFVTLSIGTTEATAAKTYSLYYPRLEEARLQPLSALAYAAANAWHVLASRQEVDAARIGIVGHSFGGKWAMFASCLFDRFACAAWSDPGIVFDESRPSVNYWEPWYLGYHPPPWRTRGLITPENPARGLYPRLVAAGHDLHELHVLMAPRPLLVSGGSEDPAGRWTALNHSVAVNRLLGHEHRVVLSTRPGHAPDASSNRVVVAFFEHFLGQPPGAAGPAATD